jgi:hypothetical protein
MLNLNEKIPPKANHLSEGDVCRWYLRRMFSIRTVYVNKWIDISLVPSLNIDQGFNFAKLRKQNIPQLIDFHDNYAIKWNYLFSKSDVANRLKSGHQCYIALENERLIGFIWFAMNKIYSPDLHCTFSINENCVVSYNGFVHPHFRGRNILPAMRRMAFTELSEEGFKQCFDYVRATNKSVIRSNLKFSTIIVGKIIYGEFLGCYFLLPILPSDLGIKVCDRDDPFRRWKSFLRKCVRITKDPVCLE